MNALAEVVTAADRALDRYAIADPAESRFGPRLADADRRFALEAVYEGYLMHYRTSRAFQGMDPDLLLLAGDSLYALGLDRLAEAGDIAAIMELADLISLSASAEAAGHGESVERLWAASAEHLAGAATAGARAIAEELALVPGEG